MNTLLVLFCAVAVTAKHLPKGVPMCHQEDPHLMKCLKNSFQGFLPLLGKGMPELGIPPLEPLVMHENMTFKVPGLKLKFCNITVYGFTKGSITRFEADRKGNVQFNKFTPKLTIVGLYKMKGEFAGRHLEGHGHMKLKLYDVNATHTLFGHFENKDGHEYLKVVDYHDIARGCKSMKVHFEGLKHGEDDNKHLNAHSHQLWQVMKPTCDKVFGGIFKRTSAKLFDQVPMENLLIYRSKQ